MTRRLSEKNLGELGAHLASGEGPEKLKLSAPEKKRKRGNEESEIQKACIRWWGTACAGFGVPEDLLFSIPNGAVLAGGARERAIQANILKAEGMRPGVPDLFLAVPSRFRNGDEQAPDGFHCGLFIEMKKPDGATSPAQDYMSGILTGRGYKAAVCRSLEEFKKTVTDYLS